MAEQLFISMTQESFKRLLQQIFREEIEKISTPKHTPEYKTRQQTSAKLGISLPTLDSYVKLGHIRGLKVGTRIRFEDADIQAAAKEIPSIKYSRRGKRNGKR